MSDEFRDHINPVGGKGRIDGLEGHEPAPQSPRAPRSLAGRIISVNVGRRHPGGEHRLDVTVGAGDNAEVILRINGPVPPNIEGKRAVLYIDD